MILGIERFREWFRGYEDHYVIIGGTACDLLMAEEGLAKTANDRISVAKPIEMEDDPFFEKLAVLYEAVYDETGEVRTMVKEIVPTYKMPKGKE